MNRLFAITWILWPVKSWAQGDLLPFRHSPTASYVILNLARPDIHHVLTERTGDNYIGITSAKVEIYNILRPQPKQPGKPSTDTLLISLSILPLPDGQLVWKSIQADSLSKLPLLSIDALTKLANERIISYFHKGKPLNRVELSRDSIVPIVQRGNRYYLANTYVLTSFFIVRPHTIHSLNQADMATIDSNSPLFSADSLLNVASSQSGNKHAQLWAAVQTGNIIQSKSSGYYEFWSNPRPSSHANWLYYGMDRFLYKPGIGIVSGKYEAFFSERNQFIDNFLDIVSIDGKRIRAKR